MSAYSLTPIAFKLVALATAGSEDDADDLRTEIMGFLPHLFGVEWRLLILSPGEDEPSELVDYFASDPPSLIVMHRGLTQKDTVDESGLGPYLTAILRDTPHPILVLPGTVDAPVALPDSRCEVVRLTPADSTLPDHIFDWIAFIAGDGGRISLPSGPDSIRAGSVAGEIASQREQLSVHTDADAPSAPAAPHTELLVIAHRRGEPIMLPPAEQTFLAVPVDAEPSRD